MQNKHKLLIAFQSLALLATAQNYDPVRAGMHRAFADPTGPSRMYSLALDSMLLTGSDTILFNYFVLNDTMSHYAGCGYLGGDECWQAKKPSWAGLGIQTIPQGIRFHNAVNDTLDLQFPTAPSDTTWFYSDGEQRFGLILLNTDTASFLGVLDSAHFYQVIHVDPLGDVIDSPLNEAPITIGKSLGIVEFLQVDSFPTVLRRLHMIGDAERQIGLFCITDASINDHAIGDVVQYRHHELSLFPTIEDQYHRKETVLTRMETATTVTHSVEEVIFHDGSTMVSNTLQPRTFSKIDTIAKIPFESFMGMNRSMRQVDRCGLLLWVYDYDPDNTWSTCPYGPCWSPYVNGKGPNPSSEVFHMLGVGSGHQFSQQFLPGWGALQYVSHSTYITYFKKNGIPCGTEAFVGIAEAPSDAGLSISPVPTDGRFTVRADRPIRRVDVLDLQGRTVCGFLAFGPTGEFDLNDYPTGTYALHVQFT
ncbi:MAG TPA: hypothetical protein PK760_05525, partial [Flavobacteriales bacterium]|nr:hypothetical protein [Flavobacteriales bacterium]